MSYKETFRMNQRDFDEENQEAIKENLKADLINDLISVSTIMDELWKYHPENPERVDIVSEYNNLIEMKKGIETELDDLELDGLDL
jgi:capsule polysaccharide export protein KpsE/RkpR